MEFTYATYFTREKEIFWSYIREFMNLWFFAGVVFHIPLPLKLSQVNTSNPRRKGKLKQTHV